MKSKIYLSIMLTACVLMVTATIKAQPGAHDPSQMWENNGKYFVYCTGQGVYKIQSSSSSFSSYSTASNVIPNYSWIQTYVPGFAGFYWAPELMWMNNKYYLYYSCSLGARPCCIGVASSPSLTSPTWTDLGVVVYSTNSTVYGSIDPDVFWAQDGTLWMAYGSHLNGIVLVRLNPTTSKIYNSTRYVIANNDCEAAHIDYNGGYYYVFFNRGDCCAGTSSTYTIYVGRSTSLTGPYLDKNGNNCASGGGTVFLKSTGRYIGPGHYGYGCGKLTYHFYDGNDNGTPKLAINTVTWTNGWPVAGTLKSTADDYTEIASEESQKIVSQSISIYPTVVNANLTVQGATTNCSYKIYSVSGALVKQGILSAETIDVSGLTSGMYSIFIENNNEAATLKFVKN